MAAQNFKVKHGLTVGPHNIIDSSGNLTIPGNITITGTLAQQGGAQYATQSYVTTAISNIIDAAPTTLDTLNELAAAIGDDANFITTISTTLAGKADSSSLATVATSGSYNDLTNKPSIPSSLTDLGITDGTSGQVLSTDGAGNFTFEDAASGVTVSGTAPISAAQGDLWFDNVNTGELYVYENSSWLSTAIPAVIDSIGDIVDVDLVTSPQLDGQALVWDSASSTWIPGDLFSGSYNDLTNKPTLFSGSYNDLTNKPTIPTTTSQLTNDSGFITSSALSGYATESYVTTAISNVIDAAPAALDTLNELAAALGDDANYASTVTTALSGKQATLVSGTNIKTINGTSILGSGDITISGGGASLDEILTPTNISPATGSTLVSVLPTLTASTYYSLYGKAMAASEWQISTSSSFSTIAYSNTQSGTAVSHTVVTDLLGLTQYYWRVRYKDISNNYSPWSTAFSFTTESSNAPQIGAFYEGGYYVGKLNLNGTLYYLITAPKSAESDLAWVSSNIVDSNLVVNGGVGAAGWTGDGALNTTELISGASAAGGSAPAAEYCQNLVLNGYSDWYLPSENELEIAYFNLKPTTTQNSTGGGYNSNSVPSRGYDTEFEGYTTTSPAQTSVAIFQSGGAQAFATVQYWNSNHAYGAPFPSGFYKTITKNFSNGVTSITNAPTCAVRPFRKVAIV